MEGEFTNFHDAPRANFNSTKQVSPGDVFHASGFNASQGQDAHWTDKLRISYNSWFWSPAKESEDTLAVKTLSNCKASHSSTARIRSITLLAHFTQAQFANDFHFQAGVPAVAKTVEWQNVYIEALTKNSKWCTRYDPSSLYLCCPFALKSDPRHKVLSSTTYSKTILPIAPLERFSQLLLVRPPSHLAPSIASISTYRSDFDSGERQGYGYGYAAMGLLEFTRNEFWGCELASLCCVA